MYFDLNLKIKNEQKKHVNNNNNNDGTLEKIKPCYNGDVDVFFSFFCSEEQDREMNLEKKGK